MGKVGLVLSGGGAKGAYQVGVMKALLDMDVAVDMISGASIGALNSAVLASATDLRAGTDRLERMWRRLAEIEPLQPKGWGEHLPFLRKQLTPYLTFLASSGLRFNIYAAAFGILWKALEHTDFVKELNGRLPDMLTNSEEFSILSDQPLHDMMEEFLDIEQLQKSIPLYVAVFQQENIGKNVAELAAAEFLGIENKDSLFKHIQSLPKDQQKDILLASAAIPLLFQSRKDEEGMTLTDGGQGGWIKAQGNTPVTPLVEAGCEYIIVSHLSNGSLWHRYDFPNTTCVEIRPNPNLDLSMKAMFDFSAETIGKLQTAGYQDTIRQLGRIKETLDQLAAKREINKQVAASSQRLKQTEADMQDAVQRLKNMR